MTNIIQKAEKKGIRDLKRAPLVLLRDVPEVALLTFIGAEPNALFDICSDQVSGRDFEGLTILAGWAIHWLVLFDGRFEVRHDRGLNHLEDANHLSFVPIAPMIERIAYIAIFVHVSTDIDRYERHLAVVELAPCL